MARKSPQLDALVAPFPKTGDLACVLSSLVPDVPLGIPTYKLACTDSPAAMWRIHQRPDPIVLLGATGY